MCLFYQKTNQNLLAFALPLLTLPPHFSIEKNDSIVMV